MNKKYELVNFCEIDKYAVKSYCVIHNESEEKNLGDITKVNIEKLPKCDMITHGSPCQDFSIAGLQKGADEGTETRSSLIWNSVKIIEHCEPKFVIWENVKNVLSKKHIHNFQKYLLVMEKLNYVNYYQVLNAKDYGVPQNRERLFCISIRKDINCGFEFPNSVDNNNLDFRNYLEDDINDEYFLNDKDLLKVKGFGANYSFGGYLSDNKIYNTITKSYGKITGNSMKFYRNGNISYLTPLETFRLMGFDDIDYIKCDNAIESFNTTKKVKQKEKYAKAGNSIVVDVILLIYKQLQKYYPNDFKNIDLISLFSGIGAFEKALDRLFEDINKGEI